MKRLARWLVLAVVTTSTAVVVQAGPATPPLKNKVVASPALGLPPLLHLRTGLPPQQGLIELGRQLFFDRRLSFNGSMSCAMCHVPEEGFTSHASRTALGIEGKSLQRNAPSLLNVAWQARLFHDGREASLTRQTWLPLLHADEMANPSVRHVLRRIRGLGDYTGKFERIFRGAGPSVNSVAAAIAAFEVSLVAANSRFDRWRFAAEATALSEVEQWGFNIFAGKGRCAVCHLVGSQHALFADGQFHVTGAGLVSTPRSVVVPLAPGVQTVITAADLADYSPAVVPDLGRYEVTRNLADRHAFKTPSLRNVAHTAPYMHDGSLASLDEVVDFYDRGGGDVAGRSSLLVPLKLSAEEKGALVAFLRALDGDSLPRLMAGSRPRQP
jgi:cytochrome c peroxidase